MKTIRDGQLLGEQGVNLVQSIILKMGYTWHPSNQAVEAGIDGWVELRDTTTGAVKNSWIAIQSKARSTLVEHDGLIRFACTSEDIEYWMQGSSPVILVVSKPLEGKAWWVSVKDYFRGRDITSDKTVVFDVEQNRLTEQTAEDWKGLATLYGAGTYFTPTKRQEELTSNLLSVDRFAPNIFSASSPLASGKEVREKLKEGIAYAPSEWAFGNGKTIYSFHDLSEPIWSPVCDATSVLKHDTDSIAYSDDPPVRSAFIRLLDSCLRKMVRPWQMAYSAENICLYFLPSQGRVVRDIAYQSRLNRTTREVVKRYMHQKDKTRIAYYRHSAMEYRFIRLVDQWYLMIEPTYVFTSDGTAPDPYREEHLAKIKSFEGDAAISGSIFMFADILRDKANLFDDPYPFLGFGQILSSEIDAGIDDDAWARVKKSHEDSLKAPGLAPANFGAGLFD